MKLAFITAEKDLPEAKEFDYAQTIDQSASFKSVDGKWVKHEVILKDEKTKQKEVSFDDEGKEVTKTVEVTTQVFVSESYKREFPLLDFGFVSGEPTITGKSLTGASLEAKFVHDANTYFDEVVEIKAEAQAVKK